MSFEPLLSAAVLPVLILVVMEYTQWAYYEDPGSNDYVLILVVMEYTQWGHYCLLWRCRCLNPCCNGIYSMSTEIHGYTQIAGS